MLQTARCRIKYCRWHHLYMCSRTLLHSCIYFMAALSGDNSSKAVLNSGFLHLAEYKIFAQLFCWIYLNTVVIHAIVDVRNLNLHLVQMWCNVWHWQVKLSIYIGGPVSSNYSYLEFFNTNRPNLNTLFDLLFGPNGIKIEYSVQP